MVKKKPAKRSTPVVVKPRPTQSPSRSLGNENRVEALATALGGFQQRLVDLEEMNDMFIKRVTVMEQLLEIGVSNNA